MDKLEKVEEKLDKVNEKFEETGFAMEMLQDKKRTIRYMFIIILILILALVGTNIGWFLYESQFETLQETETTTIDSGNGIATYLENSKSGDINYGENN